MGIGSRVELERVNPKPFSTHSAQVFEVLVEAWTLRRKTDQIGLKRTRNGILRIAGFNLMSRRNDMNRPLFQYAKPCKKWIKRRGKEQSVSHRSVPRSSTVPPNDP
uniref:Uncharacterized protein n=1 Tax=Solanum tuberosum TaxID=4113 RepID=M1D8W0_SOLTU